MYKDFLIHYFKIITSHFPRKEAVVCGLFVDFTSLGDCLLFVLALHWFCLVLGFAGFFFFFWLAWF